MYVAHTKKAYKGKIHSQYLLQESYRVKINGKSVVKHRTILNLTHLPLHVIDAIKATLKQPKDTQTVFNSKDMNIQMGKSVGSVYLIYQIARKLGIQKALGTTFDAKLALWQIIARIIEQGSRLSAVRLDEHYAMADILKIEKSFNENNLYSNLDWLAKNQARYRKKLYDFRHTDKNQKALFLYDVTSSYLEGQENHFGEYGYNRDKKRGKKQIVVGLLCDLSGIPVSVEVFRGNTSDVNTLSSQIQKSANNFGVEKVVFVGDRGMIKSTGIHELKEAGFHYITAITKKQIQTLIANDAIQMELFDQKLVEIQYDGERYILKRNPIRAKELKLNRESKLSKIKELVIEKNQYLATHKGAWANKAMEKVSDKISQLNADSWLKASEDNRVVSLIIDRKELEELEKLDGCYVLRSNLEPQDASKDEIHARYKDLSKVERAFRLFKTGHLELRPVYVRKEESTRGHVLVVMLSLLIRKHLEECWRGFNVTVEEGLDALGHICRQKILIDDKVTMKVIPSPTGLCSKLFAAADVKLPKTIAENDCVRVYTEKRLESER